MEDMAFDKIAAFVIPQNFKGNEVEATSGFARAAARRLARLPIGAFVRKLNASGYP